MDINSSSDTSQENKLEIKRAHLAFSDEVYPVCSDESNCEDVFEISCPNENNSHTCTESKDYHSKPISPHSKELDIRDPFSLNSMETRDGMPANEGYTQNQLNGRNNTPELCDEISPDPITSTQFADESSYVSPDPGYESALINTISPLAPEHDINLSISDAEPRLHLSLASSEEAQRIALQTNEAKSISPQLQSALIREYPTSPTSNHVYDHTHPSPNLHHDTPSDQHSISDFLNDSDTELAATVIQVDDAFHDEVSPEAEINYPTHRASAGDEISNGTDKPENTTNRFPPHPLDGTSSSSSDRPTIQATANIDLDIQVIRTFGLETRQDVENLSQDILKTFIAERYHIEVSAKANATAGTSTASASTSATVIVDGQTSNSGDSAASNPDPVGDLIDSLPRSDPNSVVVLIARNLAEMGDEINQRFGPRLDQMIKLVPVKERPFEAFYDVARALFNRRPTSWGQLIALFYFGYRLIIQRLRLGIRNALFQVVDWLIGFLRELDIFNWIAQQGGWGILRSAGIQSSSSSSDERNNSTTTSSNTLVSQTTTMIPDDVCWNLGWIIPFTTICFIVWKYYRR